MLWTSPLGDISYLKDTYVAPVVNGNKSQQQTDANTNNANQQGTDSSASSTTHPNGNLNNSVNNTNTVHTNNSNNSADGSGSDSNTSGNTNATIEINPSGSVFGAVVNQPQNTSSQPHVQQGTADQNTIFVQTPPKEQSYLNQSNSNQNVSEQTTTKPLHDSGLQAGDDIPNNVLFWI